MKKLNFRNVISITFSLFITLFLYGCDSAESILLEIGNQELSFILENNNNAFIYIGTPECFACVEFEPVLENALTNIGKEIYYFNIYLARQDDISEMQLLIEKLGVLVTPTILYVENGEVIDSLLGTHSKTEIIAFFEIHGD